MTTDYVITGSGVAAAAIAWKLLRANPKADITILEAGAKVKMRDFAIFQDYLVTNREPYLQYRDLNYRERDQEGENLHQGGTEVPMVGSRLMMYGGSTVHWGGWAFRLKPEDFHLRTNTGIGIDWPFGYEELAPYYGEAENYIGVSGDSLDGVTPRTCDYPFRAFPYTSEDGPAILAFEKLGIGYSHLPIARQGVSNSISSHAPCQTTGRCKYCPFGSRYVAANSLDDLQNLEEHPNLKILMETVVEEVLMESRTRARGVRCHDRKTGVSFDIEAECVIVASGGVESPKLLQRSISEYWRAGLGNDAGLVGRHIVTHPFFVFEGTLKNPELLQPQMGFPTLVSRHFDSPSEQSKGKYILVNPADNPKYKIGNGPAKQLHQLMQAGYSREDIQQALSGDVTVEMHGLIEVFSRENNYIKNGTRPNRMGLIDTVVNYTADPGFAERMNEIEAEMKKIFAAMGSTRCDRNNVSWRADHAGCTTRMSDDPQEGVVDRNLRIHGTENVYVCSNASFSSLGAVNPTLTLTALAMRLANHLIEQKAPSGSYCDALPGDLVLAASR